MERWFGKRTRGFWRIDWPSNSFRKSKFALVVDEKTYAQQLDLLRFQVQEISGARLQIGEDESVADNFQRASNAAKLLQLSQSALDLLGENENSLLMQAGAIARTLQELHRTDSSAAGLLELNSQAVGAWRELQSELSRYAEKVGIDPAQLQQLEERLNLIQLLKRKYGATLAEVIAFGEEAKSKLQSLESRDVELARLNSELQKLDAEMLSAGKKLSAARKKVIPQLAKAVGKQLADLGFKQSKFDVAIASELPFQILNLKFPKAALTKSNSSSHPIPASRPSRCAPSRRPAKWRA